MRIKNIKFNNFRIYKGKNNIDLSSRKEKNISIIAGKNGFGKTTFLTSLIWCFYGKLMIQVEDKYRKDIKNIGGYDNFLKSLISRNIKDKLEDNKVSVEILLEDLLIPSIPCRTVSIKREYDITTKEEVLKILIDGDENQLTKDVGFEVFINDFILPREIAKFFFFDAEKIVSLAEAKSKPELRNLSRAYSEVLGIKKYEELKKNLESLQTKLRRRGVNAHQKSKLDELLTTENDLEKLIEHNQEKQDDIGKQLLLLNAKSDALQEKLIREGNAITLDELKEFKAKRDNLKEESIAIKSNLKKLLDLMPLVIAGKHLTKLYEQLRIENNVLYGALSSKLLQNELKAFSNDLIKNFDLLNLDSKILKRIEDVVEVTIKSKTKKTNPKTGKVYLEFKEETFREFEAIYTNINTTFLSQFNSIVKEEKINRALYNRVVSKIKQAEARKNNHLAKQFREDKIKADSQIVNLQNDKNELLVNIGSLQTQLTSHKKVRSEYEKNFNLIETDKKKFEVTKELLVKINDLIKRIKQDKKYSLQKSISLGLRKLMHKRDFIANVRVNILDDVMDIDLLDKNNDVIDKDLLSKGEQQLYATALLKALVDESGIKFPVFIDSPLQKFDKFHSKNIIKEFYPTISEQVVLFPLLEKELSEIEYEILKPNLNKAFIIHNSNKGSQVKPISVNNLFNEFKKEKDVYTY
jgi:DNA sulfur modification protein DndD